MNMNETVDKLRGMQEKNLIITDFEGKVVYQSRRMDYDAGLILSKIRNIPEDFDEQEFLDDENGIYITVTKTTAGEGSEKLTCYKITDMSEHALLLKEVSSYTKSISNMSKFQTSIMNRLSNSYDTFLPGLADYCNADEVMMFINKGGQVTRSTYKDELVRMNESFSDRYKPYFDLKRGDKLDGYSCILNSSVQGQECVVLVKGISVSGSISPMDISIHNVIRLFIENSILRDQIVYESEHDKLTGLYNKGKYMSLKKECFGRPYTIAVYNFDVNNLKMINDTFGHECGDALIIKAADSIQAVCSDKVFGFRMGGDEYVMVAVNISEEEAGRIRQEWQSALDRLNREDRHIYCSMACGMVFGSGKYDYDELYARADQLMYKNKTELKESGRTSCVNEE